MPLPEDLEKEFAKLERRDAAIKGSLDRLRTMVLKHYADVNAAVRTLEDAGKANERELSLMKQQVDNLRGRVVKLETHTGIGPNLPG